MEAELQKLIEKAEQGNVQAMVMAGDCYNRGVFTEKDEVMAHKYYLMAAKQGHAMAEFMVGIDFYYGIATEGDIPLGIKYIQSAADKNVANAQYLLALLYASGTEKAYLKGNKTIYYLEKAAKQGHAEAQIKLGEAYLSGEGVNADLSQAIFWLCCAYLHSEDEEESKAAKDRINTLIQAGLPGGKERVQEVIAEIRQKYPKYMSFSEEIQSETYAGSSEDTKNESNVGIRVLGFVLCVGLVVLLVWFGMN